MNLSSLKENLSSLKETLLECVLPAGEILLRYFGNSPATRSKGDHSNIVTEADLAAERWIVGHIRARHPDHSIVAEETGYERRDPQFTWVIDPLDGTSNFAAGLPWFGVQVALLHRAQPILAAMFLPVPGTLYLAERDGGVWRDGTRVQVTAERQLQNVLCAVGLDPAGTALELRRQVWLLSQVIQHVRNFRATNCLVDLCATVDGRLGGFINLNTKIWDIAPVALMLPEAGGCLTDLEGQPIAFRLDTEPVDRVYAVVGASVALHPQLLALTQTKPGDAHAETG